MKSRTAIFALALCLLPATAKSEQARFQHNKPNYLLVRQDSLETDDNNIELNLSLRYRILGDNLFEGKSLALAYTGRFDFFWSSRESSPVINRLNNPELLFRSAPERGEDSTFKFVQIGYGHESNGQFIDSQEQYDRFNDPYKEEYLSRGWDYLTFETKLEIDLLSIRNSPANDGQCKQRLSCVNAWFNFRQYLSHGLLQGEIEDHLFRPNDRVSGGIGRVTGIKTILSSESKIVGTRTFDSYEIRIEHVTGIEKPYFRNSFQTSFRLTTNLRFNKNEIKLPLLFTYFDGYGEEIVDYAHRTHFWGIGLSFR